MLTELHIDNFAIIEHLNLQLGDGLITFTGETGAGKSIIIDAVETLLGGRAESTQVRAGSDRASVEGIFRIPDAVRADLHAILGREELLDDPDYLTLAREIRTSGRNVARVNGHSVSVGLLRDLGENLIDVHGQSEHLSLLHVNQHLDLLDRYLQAEHDRAFQDQFAAYQAAYRRLKAVQRELEELRQAEREAARRIDMLNYQIAEIEAARLRPGEEDALRDERNRLANAEGLASLAQQSLLGLDDGDPESPAVTDLFGQVMHALTGLARLDPSQSALQEQAKVLADSLGELASNLRSYLEGIEFNPRRLDQVEERLALLQILKRKYGESIPVVLDYASTARGQLEAISHTAERIEELVAEHDQLMIRLGELGSALSEKRRAASKKMEKSIESELADLQMSGARFTVGFQVQLDPQGVTLAGSAGNEHLTVDEHPADQEHARKVAYYPHGLEKVEFLIAPNPGEGFKPLAKIASGGETSRLMLALKNVLVKADHVPTLIFDEIDQGIGGRVGGVVGEKLWSLARQHQVLCITHLPQLAVFGEQHFHVGKNIQAGRTTTQVEVLQGEERLVELAQMLGSVSEGTLHSARELLQNVETHRARKLS